MNNRPPIQPELNWVTTFLTVRDAAKAWDFYTSIFGFTVVLKVVLNM